MSDQNPGQGSVSIDGDAPGATIITGSNNTVNVPPPTGAPGMFNLPRPPADFVGRAEELAELRAALKTQGALLCGLRGLGGVGKTALALVLADELRPQYPDAHILLELDGTQEPPDRKSVV